MLRLLQAPGQARERAMHRSGDAPGRQDQTPAGVDRSRQPVRGERVGPRLMPEHSKTVIPSHRYPQQNPGVSDVRISKTIRGGSLRGAVLRRLVIHSCVHRYALAVCRAKRDAAARSRTSTKVGRFTPPCPGSLPCQPPRTVRAGWQEMRGLGFLRRRLWESETCAVHDDRPATGGSHHHWRDIFWRASSGA